MKLLVVFVSALVLVAHGRVTSSEEEDKSVYAVQSEVVAGYSAVPGVEAGEPQNVFEAVPVDQAFGAEAEPRVAPFQDPAPETVPAPGSGVYIPITARVCTNAACANVCQRLGFRYGFCISLDTCYCSN